MSKTFLRKLSVLKIMCNSSKSTKAKLLLFSNKLTNKSLIGHTGHSGQNHFLSHHITKNIDLIDLITVHIKAKITFD